MVHRYLNEQARPFPILPCRCDCHRPYVPTVVTAAAKSWIVFVAPPAAVAVTVTVTVTVTAAVVARRCV